MILLGEVTLAVGVLVVVAVDHAVLLVALTTEGHIVVAYAVVAALMDSCQVGRRVSEAGGKTRLGFLTATASTRPPPCTAATATTPSTTHPTSPP